MNETQIAAHPPSFNEKISFTADGVAYRRTFTGIPYSNQIFHFLENNGGMMDPKEKARADAMPGIIPLFESRYLITDQEPEKSGISQVIELASGLSPRGFTWAHNPMFEYVEVDLPDKMSMKRKVVSELHRQQGTSHYSNLHLLDGNVIDQESWAGAVINFERAPIFVICEGLLRYVNWPDKEKLSELVQRTLSEHGGGTWVTPDIELLSDVNATAESRARYDMMAREWGFDVRPNLFEDIDHARRFFESFGFKIELRPHLDVVDQLVSPKRLSLADDVVQKTLGRFVTFVMSL